MRTLLIVGCGLVAVALVLWVTPGPRRMLVAAIFSFGWLLVTLWNLRIGLSHGYSLREEVPIHLVLYGVPVAAAWLGLVMISRR